MDDVDFDVMMKHPRSIIHIDVDCFYAQVEMARKPEYRNKPLGVRQKNIVVTSNYVARQYGIKKCMLVEDALLMCPGLILVCGEDLTNYRRAASDIWEILLEYTPLVERLGFDESYIDVTGLIDEWATKPGSDEEVLVEDHGEDHGEDDCKIFRSTEEECPCGCHSRLRVASRIARDMRKRIKKQLNLTCSAGIGHNKLTAKLGGSLNKPDQQTLVYPWAASALLSSVGSISRIPGIGAKTLGILTNKNINSIEDIRSSTFEELEAKVGRELSKKLKDNAEGIDDTIVKPSGKPQTIGLEDGFSNVSLVAEVETRLGALLRRLTELANEDGRIPIALKITVRKNDSARSSSKRETRQCALPKNYVPSNRSGIYDNARILALAMKLFHRAVDVTRPFHLTLLGVAFTKFEERVSGRSSIASFLRKQVAVQSVLDISSEGRALDVSLDSPMSTNQDSSNDGIEHDRCELDNSSPSLQNDLKSILRKNLSIRSNSSNTTDDEDISNEAAAEPSPKKTKLEVWLSGRRESPSNEMAGLRLGPSSPISTQTINDSTVLYKNLPIDLQRDVGHSWQGAKTKQPNNILKYFIANK